MEGIRASERKIHGFSRPDAVLSGVEARTSSPVRIVRNETLEVRRLPVFTRAERAQAMREASLPQPWTD